MPTEEITYRQGIESHLRTQDFKLDKILDQTTKTNGRVSAIEQEKLVADAKMKLIVNMLYALGSGFVFIIGSVTLPIITAFISTGRL